MALSTFVIVSNISNLSDARYCAGMGVDVLGFVMETDHNSALNSFSFSEITGWVAGVSLLGEFFTLPVEEINKIAEEKNLDFVLIPDSYSPEDVLQIKKPVVLKIEIETGADIARIRNIMRSFSGAVRYFSLNSDTNSGQNILKIAKELAADFPVLLGSGLTPNNVLQIIETVKPAGIILKGGEEIKPGLRDFNELADVLELLETDE